MLHSDRAIGHLTSGIQQFSFLDRLGLLAIEQALIAVCSELITIAIGLHHEADR